MASQQSAHGEPLDSLGRYARRQTDVHAGLARERLIDLHQRLRLLSQALQNRGDDLVAGVVDGHAHSLRELGLLLETLESAGHTWTRARSQAKSAEDEGTVTEPVPINGR